MALYWLLSGEEEARSRGGDRVRADGSLTGCFSVSILDARRACRLAAVRLGRYAESA